MLIYLGPSVRRCPLCNVSLKPKNLGRHITRVHPVYSFSIAKIRLNSDKCPICGQSNDPSKMKYGLPICTKHYVSDVRRFLIRDFYLKLKERNSRAIKDNSNIAAWMANYQLETINSLLTWYPEEISDNQYLAFSEASMFAGYLLLRLLEVLPDLAEISYSMVSGKVAEPKSKSSEVTINKLFLDMTVEYELFVAVKFASSGYYDLAIDDEKNPHFLVVVPINTKNAIKQILLLRLKDANAHWHGTFRKVLVPYGISTVQDEYGRSFHFNRDDIKANFAVFRKAWFQVFNETTDMTVEDFEKLWDWLEWVVCPFGFTEANQVNATYFDDYKKFGLSKDLIFQVLNHVLPDLQTAKDIISLRNLSRTDPYMLVMASLAHIARGFKVSSSKGYIYYVPCRKWFYNKLMPAFFEFARVLELAGPSFERDIALLSSFYSKAGIRKGGLSSFGVMVEPHLKGQRRKSKVRTSRDIPWKILESSLEISIPEDNVTRKIGTSGEVDLIVYANMNIYLIELKARNLENRQAIKYMKEEAPIQCAKYAEWVKKSKQFKEILEKHAIDEEKIKSVRILICSSGVFEELSVRCNETEECFAVVPEYILFSVMSGLFTLSLKERFTSRIEHMAPALKLINNDLRICQVNLDKELGEMISAQLVEWTELITFDRRLSYDNFEVDLNAAKAYSFLGPMYLMHEAYLAETKNWILPKPLLIGKENSHKFYIGTQLGNVGTTLVCDKCKSAIKYYWPKRQNEDAEKIETIFKTSLCPLCNNKVAPSEKSKEIIQKMTLFASKFKWEIGQETNKAIE